MTDDETELIKAGAEAAFAPFANLIERLFGGAVDQIGGSWEDRLKIRREIRRLKLLRKLQAAVDQAGFAPRPISDKIWIPALQSALLEDDETLQDKWANLLANAGDPRQENPVDPMFVGILNELRSSEVRFLDTLFKEMAAMPGYGPAMRVTLAFPQVLAAYQRANDLRQLDRGDLTFGLELLERNKILQIDTLPQPINVADTVARLPHGRVPDKIAVGTKDVYRITALGVRFVSACRAPAAQAASSL